MPKTVADPEVRRDLAALVQACRDNQAAAARKLNVPKMLVHRVLRGKRLQAANHTRLVKALSSLPADERVAIRGKQVVDSNLDVSQISLHVVRFLAEVVERAVNQSRVGELP